MIKQLRFSFIFVLVGYYATAQSILGIDVSGSQGTINWTQVKAAGYVFAWAKATEGITFTDASYSTNAVNGVSAGLYMGAYHFARPDNNPTTANAVSEANNFLSSAQTHISTCELTPILDYEVSPSLTWAQQTAWIQTWMNTVQAATGIVPILYTSGSIASSLGSSLASYCKLWIADPDGSSTIAPGASYLGVWNPNWAFKQYSWTGTVPGISGNVDMDVFNGTLVGLKSLMGCSTTPPVCHKYYTSIPYTTSFENTWLYDSCSIGAERMPDKYWKSKIGGTSSSGNDYWHRYDYTGVDWTSIASGSFTPTASSGSYCARFRNAPATAGTTGALDLYVNLSALGTKQITFDFMHKESSPAPFSFDVLLSADGGSTFTTTLLSITTLSTSGWVTQTLTTTATASTSVLRFIATDKGAQDVGLDNLNIVLTSALSSIGSQTNVLCNGGLTGQAKVNVTGGVSPYSYTWSPSGGNTSTASGLVAGTYTCFIIDASSSSLTTSKVFTIIQPPAINITSVANPSTICAGSSSTLTANGSGGLAPYTYTWVGGVANSINVVNPPATSLYTVNVKDANNCIKSQTVNLIVNPSPGISAVSTASAICIGQSGTLTATGATTYSWNTGSTTASISVTPTITTAFTVIGTTNGCSNTKTVSITVNSLPNVSVASTTICVGSTGTLVASGANTYTWNTGTVGSNLSVSPTVNTNYTVTGTSTAGCVKTTTAAVAIGTAPSIAVNSTSICSGSSAVLSASGVSTYTWNTGATTPTIMVSPLSSIVYTVSGNLIGCSASATKTVGVSVVNNPTVTANNATVCSGSSATLTANGATTYSWNTGLTTASISVIPSINTTYTVVGITNGCIKTVTTSVVVNPNPILAVVSSSTLICSGQTATLNVSGANTYSWSTGATTASISVSPITTTTYSVQGINTNSCMNTATIIQSISTCTGFNNLNKNDSYEFNIYPNPTNGELKVSLNYLNENTFMDVFDNLGQVIYHEKISNLNTIIDLNEYAEGVYFIKITSNISSSTLKFVIIN